MFPGWIPTIKRSALNMFPLLGRDASLSLSSRVKAWSHLKTHWLGNKCTARTMNVPLFNSFLCCKMSGGTKAGVRILKHQTSPPPSTRCDPVLLCRDMFYPSQGCEAHERRPKCKLFMCVEWGIKKRLFCMLLPFKTFLKICECIAA